MNYRWIRHVRLSWYDAMGATLALALAAWTVASAAVRDGNPFPQVALVAATACAYVIGRSFGRTKEAVERAAASVVIAILLGFALSGPEALSGDALAPPLGYGNANGTLYVLGAGAAVLVALSTKLQTVRAAAALLTGVFGLFAAATLSRAAMILAAGVLLVALAVRRLPRWTILLAPLITAGTIAVTILLGVTNGRSVLPSLVEQLSSRRPQLWAEAMEITRDEPVFGAGPGMFAHTSPTAMSDSDARWAHSAYFQIAAELGIPGLALIAMLLLWVIGAIYLSDQSRRLALIGAALVTAFSVHAAIDYVAHFPAVVLIAALLAGLCSTRRRSAEVEAAAASLPSSDDVEISMYSPPRLISAQAISYKGEKLGDIYVIAEAGVNHNGDIALAKQLVDVAADAGADAVKFQTFRADRLVSRSAPKAEYQLRTTDAAESQLDMIKKLELSEADHELLIDYAGSRGIDFLSTPFDLASLDLLTNRFALNRIKLGSGELTNGPLLLAAARQASELIVSTGMGNMSEVEKAMGTLAFGYTAEPEAIPTDATVEKAYASSAGQEALRRHVTLLHCTSDYPTAFADVNLRAMDTLRRAFGVRVGYSDHTPGVHISLAAAAMGAQVIEKHVTIDRSLPGPDHAASLEPAELQNLVSHVRDIESAFGDGVKRPADGERKTREAARKSLVAIRPIEQGEKLSPENLGCKRPGSGVSPMRYWDYIGTVATQHYDVDELIE